MLSPVDSDRNLCDFLKVSAELVRANWGKEVVEELLAMNVADSYATDLQDK